MKSLFALIIKALIFLAVFYFGIIMLLEVPRNLHEQAQENYQAIFIQPQQQAESFEDWTELVRTAIRKDQQVDPLKHYAIYLLLPSMRDQYKAYYRNFLQTRQQYQQIVNKLEKSFAENQALKLTWQMVILSESEQQSMSISNWGEDLYRLLTNPAKNSEALVGFVKFNVKKKELEKQLNRIHQQLQNDSTVLQTNLINK